MCFLNVLNFAIFSFILAIFVQQRLYCVAHVKLAVMGCVVHILPQNCISPSFLACNFIIAICMYTEIEKCHLPKKLIAIKEYHSGFRMCWKHVTARTTGYKMRRHIVAPNRYRNRTHRLITQPISPKHALRIILILFNHYNHHSYYSIFHFSIFTIFFFFFESFIKVSYGWNHLLCMTQPEISDISIIGDPLATLELTYSSGILSFGNLSQITKKSSKNHFIRWLVYRVCLYFSFNLSNLFCIVVEWLTFITNSHLRHRHLYNFYKVPDTIVSRDLWYSSPEYLSPRSRSWEKSRIVIVLAVYSVEFYIPILFSYQW